MFVLWCVILVMVVTHIVISKVRNLLRKRRELVMQKMAQELTELREAEKLARQSEM